MEESPITVLYVDDEHQLLEIGKLFLEKFEHLHVDIAPSAKSAFEILESGSFDAIISDYQMPGMDGIQFLNNVRQNLGDIPFILFTGRGREEVVIQAINNGADFYIQKGGDPKSQFAELAHKVRQAVSRRQAEHALRESEQTSRTLLDATTDAVTLISTDLTILLSNEEFARRFNQKPEEIIGKNVHSFIPSELAKNREEKMTEAITSKKPVSFQDRRNDRVLENSYYPIIDERGDVSRLAVYVRDVTDRILAEQRLHAAYEQIAADEEELREKYEALSKSEQQVRESEKRFRSLTENSLDTIMLFDKNLRHLYVNPNAERETGIPVSQYIGKTHGELGFPPDMVTLWEQTLKEVFSSGINKRIEFKLPSGIWVDWLVVPIRGDGGEVEQVITSSRDITDRKKAEEHIKLIEFSIEQSSISTIWIDQDAHIIRVNKGACDALGYSKEELSKMSVTDIDPLYNSEIWNQTWSAIQKKNHISFESQHKRKDDSVFPVAVSASYFEYEGQQLCISFDSDISERKRAEEEIHAAYEQIAASEDALKRNYQELLQSENALRESEHRLSDIINFAPDATLAIDATGSVIAWNHAIEEMTGVATADILGKGNYEYSIPFYGERYPILVDLLFEDLEKIHLRYPTAIREGTTLTAENLTPILIGEEKILWAKASPLYNQEGKVIGAIESIRDVTEWRQVTHALEESEARFRAFFDQAFQLAGVLDLSGNLIQANETALNLIGKDGDSVLFKPFWETPWWKNQPDAQEKIKDAIFRARKGEVVRFETTHPEKDGTLHYIDFSLKPITDKNGTIVALLPEGRDITDIKKIEADLRRSRKYLRKFFNHSPNAIFIHDETGRIIDVNTTMCQLYRVSYEEAITYSIQDYTGPDSSMSEVQSFWGDVLSGTDHIFIWHARRPKDKSIFDVEVHLTRIDGDDGPLILANVHDITTQIVAEKRSQDSERQFKDLFNNTADAIVIHNIKGRILEVNEEICRRLGYSRGELLNMSIPDIIEPEYDSLVQSKIREIQKTGRAVFETVDLAKDGTHIPSEIISRVIKFNGEDVILSTARDITHHKQTEEALQKANRQLNLLTRITRHDINNNLTSILGYVDISEGIVSDPPLKENISKIKSLASAIQGHIRFSETYENLGNQEPQWQNLHHVINRLSVPTSITLTIDIPDLEIYADMMVEKVFFNLLDNSSRHGDNVTKITITSWVSDEGLKITWEDNGTGIKEDEKERIFERGYGKNTGLGLFMVREILSLTDITIKETGEESKGARFEILVPIGKFRIISG